MKKQITYFLFCLMITLGFQSCAPVTNIDPGPNPNNNIKTSNKIDFTIVLFGSVVGHLNRQGYTHTYHNIILAKPYIDQDKYIALGMGTTNEYVFNRENLEFTNNRTGDRYDIDGRPIDNKSLPNLEWYTTSYDGLNLRIYKDN